jgi:hypothetical protein
MGIARTMTTTKYRFHSLEDFLISTTLSIDSQFDDGWGAAFPVKGSEINASILFADISGFSARTSMLSPAETLVFVNNFFAWITAEALQTSHGIIDKYIGDEIMIVFSKEFGSDDPFVDAVRAARWMGEHDALDFSPHIGIASGPVMVGYVGTPLRYNCSVFGAPVALAARCAAVKPDDDEQWPSTCIVVPAQEWSNRELASVFPPLRDRLPDGTIEERPHFWTLSPPRSTPMKNMGNVEVQVITNQAMHMPSQSAEDRAREAVRAIHQAGRYWSAEKHRGRT